VHAVLDVLLRVPAVQRRAQVQDALRRHRQVGSDPSHVVQRLLPLPVLGVAVPNALLRLTENQPYRVAEFPPLWSLRRESSRRWKAKQWFHPQPGGRCDNSHNHRRTARGDHGLPKVLPGPAMPYPSTSCRQPTPETEGRAWPSSTDIETPRRPPLLTVLISGFKLILHGFCLFVSFLDQVLIRPPTSKMNRIEILTS
jgi:hypothetical protein